MAFVVCATHRGQRPQALQRPVHTHSLLLLLSLSLTLTLSLLLSLPLSRSRSRYCYRSRSESRVRGLVVMIVACQVMDLGSLPGGRIFLVVEEKRKQKKREKNKNKVLPGLEPGFRGSKPHVLTNYTIEPSVALKE